MGPEIGTFPPARPLRRVNQVSKGPFQRISVIRASALTSNGRMPDDAASAPQPSGSGGARVSAQGGAKLSGDTAPKSKSDQYFKCTKTLALGYTEKGYLMKAQREAEAARCSTPPPPPFPGPTPPPHSASQPPPPPPSTCRGVDRNQPELKIESDPFEALGIDYKVMEEAGSVRVRQHVNPLENRFQTPTENIDWGTMFEDPTRPLCIDIGCGSGRYVLLLGKRWEGHNCIGLEIRRQLVDRANKWSELIGLGPRVRFLFTNATISMKTIFESYPGPIELVSVQFPDPHFKKKHRKRRTVQANTARDIVSLLAPGGRVFLQSDVEEIAIDMRDQFESLSDGRLELGPEHASSKTFPANQAAYYEEKRVEVLREEMERTAPKKKQKTDKPPQPGPSLVPEPTFHSEWAGSGWLLENPLGVPTEREVYTNQTGAFGGVAHRVILVKKKPAEPSAN